MRSITLPVLENPFCGGVASLCKRGSVGQQRFIQLSSMLMLRNCLPQRLILNCFTFVCILLLSISSSIPCAYVCTLPRYSGWSRNHTHIRGLQGLLMVLSVVWLGGWGSGPCHPNPGCAKNGWHGGDDDDDSDPLYGNPCCEKA